MEVCDIGQLDGARFHAALELHRRLDLELDPDLPATTADELRLLASVDHTHHADHVRVVALENDDEAVALGHLGLGHDPANPTLASAEVSWPSDVDAGRIVLAELLDRADADGRTNLMGGGPRTDAQSSFWTALGADERYVERFSELDVAAVDDSLMASWIDGRHDRAGDLDLVAWVDVCPAAHLDAFVTARNAMRDAPIDDLEMVDEVHSPQSTRREEVAAAAIGLETLGILAITPDGNPAGLTIVQRNTHRPAASWQGDTVVLVPHRRRGVGRWLKAEMWRSLRLDRPDVISLRTGNAASNAAMLAINDAMGYRPTYEVAVWQADIATLRDGLAHMTATPR